jgi:hypothetical protein
MEGWCGGAWAMAGQETWWGWRNQNIKIKKIVISEAGSFLTLISPLKDHRQIDTDILPVVLFASPYVN